MLHSLNDVITVISSYTKIIRISISHYLEMSKKVRITNEYIIYKRHILTTLEYYINTIRIYIRVLNSLFSCSLPHLLVTKILQATIPHYCI